MKLTKFAFIVACVILFANCSKDETPAPKPDAEEQPEEPKTTESEVYFTYALAFGEEIDEWIILYNQNGDLLDSKLIESNEAYEFKSKDAANQISEKITVTRLTTSSDNINFVLTFLDIDNGSIWNKPPENAYTDVPVTGRFNILIENAPSIKSFKLSTSLGNVPNDLDYDQTTTSGQVSSLRLDGVPLFENQDYFLSFFNQQGEHRYVYLEGPNNNMQYNFDYSELLLFDDYLEVDFPDNPSRSIIRGFEEPVNYKKNTMELGDAGGFGSNPYQIGYSDIFTKFKTTISMNLDGDEYSYIKMGDKVEAIDIPSKPLVEIIKNSVNDFEFSSDQNHVRKSARWITSAVFPNFTPTTTWTVVSSHSKSQEVPMIPMEVLDQYPDLKLEELKLFSLNLFIQAGEYQNYFDSNFDAYEIKEDLIQESFNYYFDQ